MRSIFRGPRAPVTVTEDLLDRAVKALAAQDLFLHPNRQELVVTYVRATALGSADPRRSVLRPALTWLLEPGQVLGAGRAPLELAEAQQEPIKPTRILPLVEEDGLTDSHVPRLALLVHQRQNAWWLETRAQTGTALLHVFPGGEETLTAASRPTRVTRRRQTVVVRARTQVDSPQAGGPSAGELVEHRLTIFAPWIPDDLPVEVRRSHGSDLTTALLGDPGWEPHQAKVLAAFAYPELLGIPAHGPRTEVSQRILGTAGDRDPSERILAVRRRRATEELGYDVKGRENTPKFLDYVVERRGYLGTALAELHAEYDRLFPPPRPSAW